MNFGAFAGLLADEAAFDLGVLPATVNAEAPTAIFALLPRNSLLPIFSRNLSILNSYH
jgi:hypothetical protein